LTVAERCTYYIIVSEAEATLEADGVLPPLSSTAQYFLRFLTQFSAVRDVDDQPLNEIEARRVKGESASERRSCPYSGSREGSWINFAALRHMAKVWSPMLEAMSLVRWQLRAAPGTLSGEELFVVSSAATYLVPYLLWRGTRRYHDGEIPGPISSLFKASLDVVTSAEMILQRRMALEAYRHDAAMLPEEVHDTVEDERLFINGAWSCAGSPKQVRQLITAATEGSVPAMSHKSWRDEFVAIVGDLDRFERYARWMTAQYVVVSWFVLQCELTTRNMAAVRSARASSPARSLKASPAFFRRQAMLDTIARPVTHCRVRGRLGAMVERFQPEAQVTAVFAWEPFWRGDGTPDHEWNSMVQSYDGLEHATMSALDHIAHAIRGTLASDHMPVHDPREVLGYVRTPRTIATEQGR